VAQWSGWLATARGVVASEEYRKLAHSPGITGADLSGLVTGICGDALDAHGKAFLALLSENGRLDFLPEIAEGFEALKSEDENVADAEVVSASELDDGQKARLAAALRQRLRRDVRLHCTVDPALIGGAVVRSGDLLIDGSLKGRLERLETELTS
jgi:F-type H+-transporting ATPase subunit delta